MWKKIPYTDEENYISGWQSLNIPRDNIMADWHPVTYLLSTSENDYIKTYKKDNDLGITGIEKKEIKFPYKSEVYISDYPRAIIDIVLTSEQERDIKTLYGCRKDFLSEEEEKILFDRLIKILESNHNNIDKVERFLKNEYPSKYYKDKKAKGGITVSN